MSDGAPLISIIMPVFNDAEYLPRALESCIKQTYKNIEIITVNDASTDDTPYILEKYTQRDKRIRVLHHDNNKKTFQAIKTGVVAARGDYCMILSGDDTFETTAVATCVATIQEQNKPEIVQFGRRFLNPEGDEIRVVSSEHLVLQDKDIFKWLFHVTRGSQGSVSNKCWKRTLITGVLQQFNPSKQLMLGEDQVIVFLAALKVKKLVVVSDIIHNYYFGAGMDGRVGVDLEYFLSYRLNIVDSMDELKKQLQIMEAQDWVWEHFVALKRQHYAWSATFAEQLSRKDKNTALKALTKRAGVVDLIVGIAIYRPEILDGYLRFIKKQYATGLSAQNCIEIISALAYYYELKKKEVDVGAIEKMLQVESENQRFLSELQSFLSIKRSTKLTLGNVKRKLKRTLIK